MDLARQASLSMGSPRQEYCSGLPFPSPGDLPDPGIKQGSNLSLLCLLPWQADFFFTAEPSGEPNTSTKKEKKIFFLKEKGEWLHFAYIIPPLKQ